MSAQDPKFNFANGRIYHAEDGSVIPEDEPVVVFRGKDEVALIAMRRYVEVMESYPDSRLALEHAVSMRERIASFQRFQSDHPERTGMGCHTCEHVSHRVHLPDLDRFLESVQ